MSNHQQSLKKGDDELKYKGYTITKRNDGRWFARMTINKKRNNIYGKSRQECYDNFKAFYNLNKNKKSCSENITYGSWIENWLNLYKVGNIKDTSLSNITSVVRNYLNELSEKPIKNIEPIVLLNAIGKGKTPKIKESIYKVLSDSFDKACKMEIINKNPMSNIKKPHYKAKETMAFPIDLESRFVNLAIKYKYFHLLLCLFQGLRIGEAIAIKETDFANNKILVSKSKNKNGILTSPKSETSNREIPMFDRTKELLNRCETIEKTSTSNEIRKFKQIMTELNEPNYTTRSLRHTFATRAMEAGIEPKVVQKWLGHSSIDITMKIYTHIKQDFEKKSTTKLNSFFDTNFDTK